MPDDRRSFSSDVRDDDGPLLARAWRAVADSGTPAMLLVEDGADPDGDNQLWVRWVSRTLAGLFTMDVSDLVGRPLPGLQLLEPTDQDGRSGWVSALTEMIGSGAGRRPVRARSAIGGEIAGLLEVASVSAHGRRGWLMTLTPAGDDAGEIDAKLFESEARFAALAEAAPIGILLSEVGLRLGYVNDAFATMCGAASYQLAGTDWLDVFHHEDQPQLRRALEGVLRGRRVDMDLRLRHDDESPQWVHLRLGPIVTTSRAAGFIGIAEDVTQRRAWEDKITYQAQHDPLTGLVNRRHLIEVLRELLTSRRGRDRRFAIMFIDLDGFKAINDTRGHEVGDRVLVEVARRLRRVARGYDLVSRVAGDEFVVVLRDVHDPEEAMAAARRQLEALEVPIRIGEQTARLSASIGVAMPNPHDTVESLIRAADHVMYQAKKAGGHSYRLAHRHPGEPDAAPESTSDHSSDHGPAAVLPQPRNPREVPHE